MSGRLTGVYQLPGGGFPPRDSKLWVRVPTDREEGGKTVYAAPIMVPINPPTHPTAPGFYDSGLLGEGPYQIQKAIFGAKDYRSRWYDVVLTSGSHTVQELIEDYDPDLYTPPVVNQVAVLRDETRTARDEAAQILEDVEAGAVPDSAVASKITAADTATRAAVDARITAVGNTAYAPASVAADVAGKLDQSTADGRYAPTVDARVPASNLPALFRTTDSQPFTADSIWNTPIGQGATFEAAGSAATANFLAATPAINDTLNGYGFYNNIARPSDPMCTGSYTPSGGSAITFTHRIPYD
ncbi:minor tail protein [Gordonia phage Whitney]|nr:minor tail protein [Gordonia phage Whitney]